MMTYDAWRISYQNSEQAARVAYDAWCSWMSIAHAKTEAIESFQQDIERLNALVRYYEDLHSKLLEG